jgi:outer membrane protein assembly factor BamA
VVTLGIASAFLFPALLAGQVPRRLKPYLPYPTLSDEICDLTGQNCEESVEEIPRPRVSIDSVKFVGTDSLSPAVRHRVLGSLKSSELAPGPFSHDWLRELEEMGPRRALREAGYFRANVVAEAQIQKVDVGSQHLDVTLRIDEGPLYHLGSIQFRSASDSNPLAFAPEPQTEIDEGSGTISLIIILDQQRQYRVGKVEVWGPDHAKEKLLQSQWETGGIFNHKKLETFFKENKYLLPADASPEDVAVLRNAKEGTVDLKFDFRVCPQAQL